MIKNQQDFGENVIIILFGGTSGVHYFTCKAKHCPFSIKNIKISSRNRLLSELQTTVQFQFNPRFNCERESLYCLRTLTYIKYVSVVSQAHCRLCFMRVVLNSAAGHHKLALLSVCQTLSLCCFNILSLPLSLDVSLLFLFVALFLVRGSNFIYHLLCPVANIGSKNTLTCSKTRNIIFSCNHRFTGAQNERF